ncbi:YciI family protein [Phenylobacterium aquaticum]|nr:YciI family protein [Phenylobacterium aquaticum]
MPTFILFCKDKPKSLDLRMATRERHLAYAGTFASQLKLGGPLLDENGDMAGSVMLFEAEAIEEAQAFSANDPYRQAGLFESVDIHPMRVTLGKLG